MILCRRPLWTTPEQKNSKVKQRPVGYRPTNSNSYTIESLYLIQRLYKESMVYDLRI